MSQALMKITEQQPLALNTFEDVLQLGKVFAASGFFSDVKDQAQAVVKILAGQELGLPPMVSMTGIHIVKGKPMLGADLLAKKVKSSGKYDYRVLRLDDKACEIEFFQAGQPLGKSSFTIEEAKRAGTQNLDKFARNMLFARTISNGVRWYCPDVTTMTTYVDGELVDDAPTVLTVQAEAEFASTETIAAIRDLWPQFGARKNGQLVPLETILKQNNWTLDTWPAERAAKTLNDLQRRALAAAESAPEVAQVHEAEVI